MLNEEVDVQVPVLYEEVDVQVKFVNEVLVFCDKHGLEDLNRKVPQIIIVGDQSAGKSTALEAIVGFRFNIVATTLRPYSMYLTFNSSCKWNASICFLINFG